jgi:hypothetical protein
MESFEVNKADSTACFSNFFDDEELTLTFLAVTSDICNHFRSTMSLQSIRNRSGKIRRRSLLSPRSSAFMQLYNGGQDDALITMTGLNYSTFHELLAIFSPIFHEYTPHVNSGCNISHLPYRHFCRGRRHMYVIGIYHKVKLKSPLARLAKKSEHRDSFHVKLLQLASR